jgi:hypothetical protein
VIDHLDDLESDFSVFHRVDDIYSLDGPRFFRLAARLSAYQGVMAVRVMDQQEKANPTPTPVVAPSGRTGKHETGFQTMSLEEADVQSRRLPTHMRGERREVSRG